MHVTDHHWNSLPSDTEIPLLLVVAPQKTEFSPPLLPNTCFFTCDIVSVPNTEQINVGLFITFSLNVLLCIVETFATTRHVQP